MILVWTVIFIVFRTSLGPGIPYGNDAMAHLFKVWYIGGQITAGQGFPAWLPYWYEGTDLFKYYQPIVYLVATPFYLITKDVFSTYKILTLLWGALMGLSIYYVVYRRLGLFPAIIAGILYPLAPPITRAYFFMGLLPQAFSYVFLPLAFHFTLRLADEEEYRAKSVAILAVVWGLFIMAHPMSAAFSMMAIFAFIAVYQATKKEKRHPLVITRYLLSASLGIGVAALWFIPAYFGKIMPPTSGEAVYITSVPIKELLGFISRDSAVTARFLPIAFSVLAIAGTLWRKSPLSWGLAAMGVFTLIFALGVQTPIYGLLPLSSAIFPEYALFGACFAFAILAGKLFERTSRGLRKDLVTVLVMLAIVSISIYESSPAFSVITNYPEPKGLVKMLNKINTLKTDGRISAMGRASAVLSYYPPVITRKKLTDGFFYQGTNHFRELANFNDVTKYDYSPDYIYRKLSQWNARYLLVLDQLLDSDVKVIPPTFTKVMSDRPWNLFYDKTPGRNFQIMDRKTLVIGKNPSAVAMVYPQAVEGKLFLDDYDWKYLSRFDRVMLIGFAFRDRKAAIDLITKLADSGRTVVIDLQNVEAEFGTESVSFMDVLPKPVTISGDVILRRAMAVDALPDKTLTIANLTDQGEPWKTVGYSGLDESIYDFRYEGKTYSALGIKKVGTGEVYFTGLNLFFHNLQAKDPASRKITDFLAGKNESKTAMPAFPVTSQEWTEDTIKFSYVSKSEKPVVVSTTWTDNWSATIDDKPLKANDYENLPMFFLPAGEHTVELKYGTTPLQVFAMIVSVISLGVVLLILIRSVRHQNSIDYPRV